LILWCVMVTGHGVQLRMESEAPIDVGFVKNEFVVAASESGARRRAIKQVFARLQRQADAGGLILNNVEIETEEVARSMNLWKLVRQQGFAFYSRDEIAKKSDQRLTVSLSHCE
jgi:hypothetical protein